MAIEMVPSSDPRFATLAHASSSRWPTPGQAAAAVALCSTSEDVRLAVEQAVKAGKRPTIISGGHCYEDFVVNNPGGTIIDVKPMNAVTQDPTTKRWKIEGGATVGDMYWGMYQGGVTIPAASCTTVGVGGHISGGGYGFLTRLYGIAPDWISAVEVVTVDAKGNAHLEVVDKKNKPDLFRALRGSGGGQYGVITAYYSDNPPPAPKDTLGVNVRFDWNGMTPERLHRILFLYSDYWNTRGRDKDTWGIFTIMNLSPGNVAQNRSPSIGFGGMFTNLDGTVDDTKVMEEFLSVFDECKPISTIVHHPSDPHADHMPDPSGPAEIVCLATVTHNAAKRPWIDFAQSNRGPNAPQRGGGFGGGGGQRPAGAPGAAGGPGGAPGALANAAPGGAAGAAAAPQRRPGGGGPRRQKYKSAYTRTPWTLEEARVFYKHLTDPSPYGGATIAMDSFGGAASRKGLAEETSDVHRDSILKMQFITGWSDPAEDAQRIAHIDNFYTDLFAASSTDSKHKGTPWFNDHTEGTYINYPDASLTKYDYWPQLYWGKGDLYPFLQRVKKKYDPSNIFHHALSVRT